MNLIRWRHLLVIVLLGATLPLGVIVSTHLATRSLERIKLRDKTITVKGFAERKFDSDWAQWGAGVTARDAEMVAAYAKLEESRAKLLAFLRAAGFGEAEVARSSVTIALQRARDAEGRETHEITGYVLSQTLSVATADVRRVAAASEGASELISQGVELSSWPPQYFFTKLDDLKLTMLGEATQNARQRAEQLVAGTTSRLGPLESASQGVFQITPEYSTEASGYGENDTTAIKKSIKAVVTAAYLIE